MKWGISRSKEVRGVKKAYKNQKRDIRSEYIKKRNKLDDRLVEDLYRTELKGGTYSDISAKWDKPYQKSHAEYKAKNKKVDDKYAKDLAAAKEKAANRLFKDGDAARNKRIANLSLGKALTQTFLMGSYGAKKYNQYRAAGETKGKSAVKGLGWNIANNLGYQLPTTVSNAQFVKNYVNDRRKNKRK